MKKNNGFMSRKSKQQRMLVARRTPDFNLKKGKRVAKDAAAKKLKEEEKTNYKMKIFQQLLEATPTLNPIKL